MRKPAVFLFDEPLSNLDAKLRVQMRAEIKRLQRRLATTAVYVTHDQIEAMTMGSGSRSCAMADIQQVGEPLEIYERPRNLFVANFIGSPPMNLLRARLSRDGTAAVASGFTLTLPATLRAASGNDAKEVVLGIRPENVVEAGEGARGLTASLPVEVEFVEPLGDEVIVHGRVGEAVLLCKLGPRRVPEAGSRLDVAIELDRVHVFDAETELRMTA